MRKDLILTAVISAVVASTITVFASGPGEPFPDVDENAYYADSITSMRILGVINGYENGNFGPDDFVTRGQLATILDRYNSALLDPPPQTASGVYPLQVLLCGLDLDLDSTGMQHYYDIACN